MTPADIESMALSLERAAGFHANAAARWMDDAERLRRGAESAAAHAAEGRGDAAGLLFRAAELRYDARGGMTAATERRRFEPGAAWLLRGVVRWVTGQSVRFHGIMVELDDLTAFELGTMTRANGWRFLGLSDQGGYR